jgi:hypothetical protein
VLEEAVVAAVAVAVAVVVAVAVAAVVHAHGHLGRLDCPYPVQWPAKHPFGPRPGVELRSRANCALLRHPRGPPPLRATAQPRTWQPAQLLHLSLRPAF